MSNGRAMHVRVAIAKKNPRSRSAVGVECEVANVPYLRRRARRPTAPRASTLRVPGSGTTPAMRMLTVVKSMAGLGIGPGLAVVRRSQRVVSASTKAKSIRSDLVPEKARSLETSEVLGVVARLAVVELEKRGSWKTASVPVLNASKSVI